MIVYFRRHILVPDFQGSILPLELGLPETLYGIFTYHGYTLAPLDLLA
jgi:hypothetical protein